MGIPNGIDPGEAMRFLDEQDKEFKVNNIEEPTPENKPITSLGKAQGHLQTEEISAAYESPWKILALDTLPSEGKMYPNNVELLIRSAKVSEIRHWSTLDETDPLDVIDKINFILNACTKFKVRGNPIPLNYNDFLEIDRYHILFRIYELTFPNQENKLWANIKCQNPNCNTVNKTQVTSKNLKGFAYPEQLLKWYSNTEKCFVVYSPKLNETLRFYLPTIGMSSKFKNKKNLDLQRGAEIDESFYKQGPYLINEWRRTDLDGLNNLKMQTMGWSEDKFLIIYKFTELLEQSKLNKAVCVCEKCKTQTESHIFLGGSFTVKDIFIISAGLDELI